MQENTQEENTQEEKTRTEMSAILRHFDGKQVNQNILKEFCELNKYEVVSLDKYNDAKFEKEHDKRMELLIPKLFEKLSEFRNVPQYGTKEEREEIRKKNNDIEWELAHVLIANGAKYQDVEIISKNLAGVLHSLVNGMGNRINNAVMAVFSDLAKKKFGEELPLAEIGEYYMQEAERLGKKQL